MIRPFIPHVLAFALPFALAFSLTSCKDNETLSIAPPATETLVSAKAVGYTYHSENGNRYVKGAGNLTHLTPIDIPLPASATWIAAVPNSNDSIWTAVLADGAVKAFKVNRLGYEEIGIKPNQLSTPTPPTLVVAADDSVILGNVFIGASSYSATAILDKTTGERAYVASNGDLVLATANTETRLAVAALPYARVLVDDNKRILLLTHPTTVYDHTAVLGSQFQHAAEISLIETRPTLRVASSIVIAAPDVIEGNALIWEDVNNDGVREIITTLSRRGEGARVVVYKEDGTVASSSPAIGVSHRWRHQIAVAPIQSTTIMSLASIALPHIGPSLEFFRLDDASMAQQAQSLTFTSHFQTSTNIDMSIAGDFDGDGKVELLLVDRNTLRQLGAFEYRSTGATLDWTLPLTDMISSNVAAVTLSNNGIAFGVGQGKSLRVWQP